MMSPDGYEDHHQFVWQYGGEVVGLLDPQPHESVLDLGCGGGQLTAEIAELAGHVVGVDVDPDLISRAQTRYPDIEFVEGDIVGLDLNRRFDAVFSNAVLHWVADPAAAASVVASHLRPGGRFVAEFGGSENCDAIIAAILEAHPGPTPDPPWYFPTEAEYAGVLSEAGLRPDLLVRFSRPTGLEGGLAAWVRTFGSWALEGVDDVEAYLHDIEEVARPHLWRDGEWVGDYVRLRVRAYAGSGSSSLGGGVTESNRL